MQCPVCGGKAVGKIGAGHYFCRDCCLEYRIDREGVQIFEIDEDGMLVKLDPAQIRL
ncbi:hypothetical protein [Ammonifex thiophilus]|uniref:hypothetical protein n=1 Tax=Ammonifex thiophilus TaxID=444093 RepID=UPI001402B785|nr:hypothetical protein [Ammonifex thiophilus]